MYAQAERGNVVLRGWGATVLLRPVPHVVCVRVTRSLAKRVEWLMGELETDDAQFAEAEIRRSDDAHASRMHDRFGVTLGRSRCSTTWCSTPIASRSRAASSRSLR